MITSYAVGISVIHLAVFGTMVTEICKTLKFMVDYPTAGTIQLSQIEATDVHSATSNEKIQGPLHINQM